MRTQARRVPLHLFFVLCGTLCAIFALCTALLLSACGSNQGQGQAPTEIAEDQGNDDGAPVEDSAPKNEPGDLTASDETGTKDGEGPAGSATNEVVEDPEPVYNTELQERLQPLLAEAASASGMQVGIAVIDLTDGTPISYQGDLQLPSASMIKLLVASALLQQIDAGTLALDQTHVLSADEIVGGSGSLAGLGVGASVTLERLLSAMIEESDNTATNALIDVLGMDEINAEAKRLGLSETSLNRRMMDEQAVAEGRENYACADDLATILRAAHEGTLASPELCEVLVADLERQQDWGGIRSGLPEGVTFAHKTGALGYVNHDGGIVEGDHPYVLVVLCGGEGFYEGGALTTMAKVASLAHETITAEPEG